MGTDHGRSSTRLEATGNRNICRNTAIVSMNIAQHACRHFGADVIVIEPYPVQPPPVARFSADFGADAHAGAEAEGKQTVDDASVVAHRAPDIIGRQAVLILASRNGAPAESHSSGSRGR